MSACHHVCMSACRNAGAMMAVMGEKMSRAGSGLLSSISAAHCPPVIDGPQLVLCIAPSVSQSVFTITEKAPTSHKGQVVRLA